MLPHRSTARVAGAALLSATLAACSLIGGPWGMRHKAAPQPAPVPAPPPPPSAIGADPVATFKFEIDPQDDVVGRVQVTHATKEDTLVDIARRFDLGYEEISRANPGVDVWLPGAGRKVVLPTQFVLPDAPHTGIIVNIAAMRLYYFPPHKRGEKQVVYTHPIGIGRVGWRTPVGVTKVVRREKNPTWRPPPSIIKEHREEGDDLPAAIGPGPDNPLGDRAFYLAWPGYLIHGTNKPAGVGLRVSHGCIHLFPEDIDALFDKIPVGTSVRVVNQPFVFGWHDGALYMQAYGSLEDDHRDWQKTRQKQLLMAALGPRVMRELAKRHVHVSGDLVVALAHDPRGIAVPVTTSADGPQESDDGANRVAANDAQGTSGGQDAQAGEPSKTGNHATAVDQVLAGALRVRDELPAGSNWDGKTDLPADQTSPPVKEAAETTDSRPASRTSANVKPADRSPGLKPPERTAALKPVAATADDAHAAP